MRWLPSAGHVPRGFCGAIGALTDVQLVLVVAEPGNPHVGEEYETDSPEQMLADTCKNAYHCYETGADLFHMNVRGILNDCWPILRFPEQMRRTWITESVLCSADVECGPVPSPVRRACVTTYLARQLELLPHATIVALGGKAHERMKQLGRPYLRAGAAAPPGCNQPKVRESWKAIAAAVNTSSKSAVSAT